MHKHWKIFLLTGVFFTIFISETYYSGSLSYYYTHTLGFPIRLQAIAWVIFVITSTVVGIITSIVSDRHIGHKNGRRIPFIRFGGPFLGIAFAVAFTVPIFGTSKMGLFASYILMLNILFCFDTLVYNSQVAIPSEEIADQRKRSSAYIQVGIASGIALAGYFLTSTLQSDDSISSEHFGMMMAAIGIAAAVFFFVSSFFLPHTFVQEAEAVRHSPPIKSFLECLKNKMFLIGEIYLTSVVCCTCIILIGIFYYFDEVSALNYLALPMMPIGVLCTWLFYKWGRERISKRLLYGLPLVVAGIAFLVCAVLARLQIAQIFLFFSAGIATFIQYMFNNMIIIEAVDEDAKRTGIRKEAEYMELDYICDSIGSLSQSVFSMILLAFGYAEGLEAGTQSVQAQNGIILATFVLPLIIGSVGIIAMLFFYPEGKEKL